MLFVPSILNLLQIVTAIVFSGRLDFNPETDCLTAADGSQFKFASPSGDELPSQVCNFFKCYKLKQDFLGFIYRF